LSGAVFQSITGALSERSVPGSPTSNGKRRP
jgi:hypothetical protein